MQAVPTKNVSAPRPLPKKTEKCTYVARCLVFYGTFARVLPWASAPPQPTKATLAPLQPAENHFSKRNQTA